VLAVHADRFLRRQPGGTHAEEDDVDEESQEATGRMRPNARTLAACLEFGAARGLDFLVILSRFQGERRAVLLYCGAGGGEFSLQHFSAVVRGLTLAADARASAFTIEAPVASEQVLVAGGVAALKFGNHTLSRKQIVPLLQEILGRECAL